MRILLSCCLLAVFAIRIPSQSTHVVGPGGHAEIRDALAVAQSGDVVLVMPGTYAHFVADVGVTIVADTPGTVTVRFDPIFEAVGCLADLFCAANLGATRLVPPAGEAVHLIGLVFPPTTYAVGVATIVNRVEVIGGTATLDGCTVRSASGIPLRAEDATLVLQGCTVLAENPLGIFSVALRATASRVTAIDSVLRGAPQSLGSYAASPALLLEGSSFHGSGLDVRGGNTTLTTGAPAISTSNSTFWISDSQVLAGNGACAVVGAGSDSRFARSTILSNATGCATPPDDALAGVGRNQPLLLGTTFTLEFRLEPNGFVFLSASPDVIAAPLVELAQPLALHPASLAFAGLWLADANGDASASWSIPNTASLRGAAMWFQGASSLTLPLQTTPVAGGVIR